MRENGKLIDLGSVDTTDADEKLAEKARRAEEKFKEKAKKKAEEKAALRAAEEAEKAEKAKRKAEERALEDSEKLEKAKKRAEEKAVEEAEKLEKVKKKAEEKALEEAERLEKAKRKAEEKARRKAEEAAAEETEKSGRVKKLSKIDKKAPATEKCEKCGEMFPESYMRQVDDFGRIRVLCRDCTRQLRIDNRVNVKLNRMHNENKPTRVSNLREQRFAERTAPKTGKLIITLSTATVVTLALFALIMFLK